MKLFSLLSGYLSRSFLKSFGIMTLGLFAIIFLFDFAEVQRQTTLKEVAFSVKIGMVCLRSPFLLEQAFPFLVFVSSLFMFWRLNRSHELVIFRSMGISLWRVILPLSLTALLIGWVELTVFNPLSSTMLTRYENLERKYLSNAKDNIAIEPTGIWLSDYAQHHQVIYRASQINLDKIEFSDLNIIILSPDDTFLERIDAASAHLKGPHILLKNGWTTLPGKPPVPFSERILSTSLTRTKIERMKQRSHTFSFWRLPEYISLLDLSGLKSLKYIMYWHSLLANSFWPAAMVFLAAAFACRPLRQGKTVIMILTGLIAGFLLYFFKDIMFAFGASGRLSPFFAAWLPPLLTFMVGSVLLFSQEDG